MKFQRMRRNSGTIDIITSRKRDNELRHKDSFLYFKYETYFDRIV